MALDIEFLALFTDTVTITPPGATDLYGREAAGVPYDVPAFIEKEPNLVQSADGREVVSRATIYVDATGIDPKSKVFYPDGTEANVVMIAEPRDEYGPHHSEISVT